MEEVPSPERIAPRSIDLLPMLPVGWPNQLWLVDWLTAASSNCPMRLVWHIPYLCSSTHTELLVTAALMKRSWKSSRKTLIFVLVPFSAILNSVVLSTSRLHATVISDGKTLTLLGNNLKRWLCKLTICGALVPHGTQ